MAPHNKRFSGRTNIVAGGVTNPDLFGAIPDTLCAPPPVIGGVPGGGGRLGMNHASMCVSKSEGYGSFFGFK